MCAKAKKSSKVTKRMELDKNTKKTLSKIIGQKILGKCDINCAMEILFSQKDNWSDKEFEVVDLIGVVSTIFLQPDSDLPLACFPVWFYFKYNDDSLLSAGNEFTGTVAIIPGRTIVLKYQMMAAFSRIEDEDIKNLLLSAFVE